MGESLVMLLTDSRPDALHGFVAMIATGGFVDPVCADPFGQPARGLGCRVIEPGDL
jgi:hypothetical protein